MSRNNVRVRGKTVGVALAVILLCVGALAGSITSYEWFDIKLTEGSGEMLGAALGAFLGVALASWLDGRDRRKERQALKAAVAVIFTPLMENVFPRLDLELAEYNKGQATADEVRATMDGVVAALKSTSGHLEAVQPAFAKNALDLLIHAQLAAAMESINKESDYLLGKFKPNSLAWFPPAPGAVDGTTNRKLVDHLLNVIQTVAH